MRKLILYTFLLFFTTNSIAQQLYGVQRGQRGYIPPPKYDNSAYISTINIYDELNKVLPKCVEIFALDEFEKEILKGLLLIKCQILHQAKRKLF